MINPVSSVARVVTNRKITRFVDSVKIRVQGGKGGDGCISMLSLFANEFAGPDGGNGGNGGHVVLNANSRVKSFNKISKLYKGQDGERGRSKSMFGANGNHTFLDVPVGTIVGGEHETLAELAKEGEQFVAAKGGAGGRGNASYLTNLNRHPRVAQMGAPGESKVLELRLRVYAHVGLIGLPNVGKSTLLKTLTHAEVKIGNYAFTTLYPQVGIIEYDDYTQLAVADLPGLIEDSHKNRGLGLSFLRSVRRCVCLLYVIDMTADPINQYETLVNELELYKNGMSERPSIIMGNKIDDSRSLPNVVKFSEYLASHKPDTKFIASSAIRGDNLEELRQEMRRMYDEYQGSGGETNSYVWCDLNKT